MTDDGRFIINDVALDIAPEQIVIQRNSINHQWRTLRTESSIKAKSGFSSIEITLKKICFTDVYTEDNRINQLGDELFLTNSNGYDKLRDLVSQIRVSPFCWVDNQMLRNAILNGNDDQAMVLALREMRINKDPSSTNVIEVDMVFSWFNYFPYTPTYTFKSDVWLPDEKIYPAESKAYRMLYRAEQERKNYTHLSKLDADQSTNLRFTQFAQMTLRNYTALQKGKDALEKLKDRLIGKKGKPAGDNDTDEHFDVSSFVTGTLEELLSGADGAGHVLADKIMGMTTSHGKEGVSGEVLLQQVLDVINKLINKETNSEYQYVISPWNIAQIKGGKSVTFKGNPTAVLQDEKFAKSQGDDILLMEREVQFNPKKEGIAVTGIHIVFEHILSTIGLIGHSYPTFQSMGGADAVATISMATTNEGAVNRLMEFYDIIEDQAHKHRLIPQGHRNLRLKNDLLNMLGLYYFVPDSIEVETNRSAPGTFNIFMGLLDNPLTPETQEQITKGQSFTTRNDIRREIVKAFESLVTYNPDILEYHHAPYAPRVRGKKTKLEKLDTPIQTHGVTMMYKSVGIDATTLLYTPNIPNESRNMALYDRVDKFAKELSKLFLNLLSLLQNRLTAKNTLEAFLLLTDQDIFGIEQIQLRILSVLKKHDVLGNLIGVGDAAKDQASRKHADPRTIPGPLKPLDLKVEVEREGRLKKLVDLFNELNEAGGTDPNAVKLRNSLRKRVQSARSNVASNLESTESIDLTSVLRKWRDFIISFVDEIELGRAEFLELDEFITVRAMREQQALASGMNCYPDFPFHQIQSLVALERPDVIESFEEQIVATNLSTKNVKISSLIDTDFFMYNRAVDLSEKLIEDKIIKRAINSIKISQGDMKTNAETSWFKQGYKNSVLEETRYNRIQEELVYTQKRDTNFWNQKTDVINKLIGEVGKSVNSSLAYNDLQDDLGPSLLELKDDGKTMDIKAIKLGKELDDKETDQWNLISNKRDPTTMTPASGAGTIRHRFATAAAIDFLNELEYQPQHNGVEVEPPGELDVNGEPNFRWPTDIDTRIVTSEWSMARPRPHHAKNIKTGDTERLGSVPAVLKAVKAGTHTRIVRPHEGLDLATWGKGKSRGKRVLAAGAGTIVRMSGPKGSSGNSINIKHGQTGYVTKYFHMESKPDSPYAWYRSVYDRTGIHADIDDATRDYYLTVRPGQWIGTIGDTGSKGAFHLHFEMWKNGRSINPRTKLGDNKSIYKSVGPVFGLDSTNESLLTRSIDQFEQDTLNGQGYTMKRAFPTFKLYFIESDMGERKQYGFDDFFSYSSVKDITVIRSRKIAADLVTITLTNISGVLNNRRFGGEKALDENGQEVEEKTGRTDNQRDTLNENPFQSLMLQPGVQIQLRLGYSNNPEDLEKVFNGVITDVGFSEGTDLVQITAQSFAIQLVQNIYGEVKSYGGWLSSSGKTSELLEELMAEPELTHFGRWTGGTPNMGHRSLLRKEWEFFPSPQDDNIFAPTGSKGIFGIFDSSKKYVLYQSTIWDVFQEMTYRHPSYIAAAVPYEGKFGPRMTMFFGSPDQLYFSRDTTWMEDNTIADITRIVEESAEAINSRGKYLKAMKEPYVTSYMKGHSAKKEATRIFQKEKKIRDEWLRRQIVKYSKSKGFIKSFRNYHAITSTQHIVANSIQSAQHNTFNVATIQYSQAEASPDTSTGGLNFGNLDTFTLMADAGIPDEEKREMFLQFPNCAGFEMAKRYALSALWKSMKEGYRGQVIIIGNPSIKPHDICYIFDEYSDMFGPIEVEQVVHRFSQETGFVTEITPDMVCHVNQEATLSTSDAMGLIVEGGLRSMGLESLPKVSAVTTGAADAITTGAAISALGGGLGVAAASPLLAGGIGLIALDRCFSPIASMFFNSDENSVGTEGSESAFGLIGSFIFRKAITRSQMAHPMRYSPLTLNSKPMLGGLPTRTVDGGFIQGIDKWFKDTNRTMPLLIDEVYDNLSINKWFGHSSGDFVGTFFGNTKY